MPTDLPVTAFPHPIRTEWKLLATLKKDNPAITQEDCAKQLGVNANTIRNWIKKPLYQSYENWFITQHYEEMPLTSKKSRADVQEELDEFAQEMLERLRDIAETTHDQKLITQIGFDALDRAGYAAAKKDSARPINLILTPEVMHELHRRAIEARGGGEILVGQVESGA